MIASGAFSDHYWKGVVNNGFDSSYLPTLIDVKTGLYHALVPEVETGIC